MNIFDLQAKISLDAGSLVSGINDAQKLCHKYFSLCEALFYKFSHMVAQQEEARLKDAKEEWQASIIQIARTLFEEAQNIYCGAADEA